MTGRAQRVIDFIETLRAPDGDHAGQLIVLRGWQKRIIREVYDNTDASGERITREALLTMARKNAKTTLVAAICLVHLCGPEAVRNGQLYSLSIDREQAGILFNYARSMVEMDADLSDRLVVTTHSKVIFDPVSGSRYTVLSGERKGKMGKSSSFLAFDELAEFGPDRTLYDALKTSTGAHSCPMTWDFSTQASSDNALFSELVDYGRKVLAGDIADQTFKAFIFEVPLEADPWDESNWYLANPALGDFRSLAEMRDFARKAQLMPAAEATFRNLYLNQRVDGSTPFISRSAWLGCGEPPDMEAFRAGAVYGALDLSSKNDLTAAVFVAGDEGGVFHVLPHFWAPAEGIQERAARDRAPYDLWAKQGYLTAKPGKTIDYRWVAQQVGRIDAEYGLAALKFDRWRIDDFERAMSDEGIDCYVYGRDWKEDDRHMEPPGIRLIPHGQGYQDMTPAVEIVEDLIAEGRIRHGNHPVLTMCAANTRVQSDPAGNRKFDKIKSTGRIDGIVALAMALNGAARAVQQEKSIYETRGIAAV